MVSVITMCNLIYKAFDTREITKNNNNKFAIMLKRNSIKVHSNTRPH